MIKLTNLNMVMILVVGCKSGGKVTSSATEKLMMKETLKLIFISTRLPPKASSASGKKIIRCLIAKELVQSWWKLR